MKTFNPFPEPNLELDKRRFWNTFVAQKVPGDIADVHTAEELALEAHSDQVRADGNPYMVHLYRVASYAIHRTNSPSTNLLCAAVLHDAVEDSGLTITQVSSSINDTVASMVEHLTRPRQFSETFEERSTSKEAKSKNLLKAPQNARLIKAWDYADNILSMRYISASAPFYKKIPRWIAEAEDFALPYCKQVDAHAAHLIQTELDHLSASGMERGKRTAF